MIWLLRGRKVPAGGVTFFWTYEHTLQKIIREDGGLSWSKFWFTVVSAQYEQSTLRERTNTSEDKLKVEKNTNIETVSWFLANIYFKSHIDRQSPTAKYKI